VIYLGYISIVKIFLMKLLCYHDNHFKHFMFGKYICSLFLKRGVVNGEKPFQTEGKLLVPPPPPH
jgi:hypothetical protein